MSWQMVGRAPAQPNCDAPLILEHTGSGRQQIKRCNASSEEKCEPCAYTYRNRVRTIAESARWMFPGNAVVMVTLTAPSEIDQHCRVHSKCSARRWESCDPCPCTPDGGVNLAEWNSTCSKRWNRFIEDLRRHTGIELQYFRAAEVQERGALHFHVLIRLPRSRGVTLTEKGLRRLAIHHGFGHEVKVDAVNDERASSYVAKYVSKSCSERTNMPWLDLRTGEVRHGHGRYRCWTSSRRWGLTMAGVRLMQRFWCEQRARGAATPAQPAPTLGPSLDHKGLRYERPPSFSELRGGVG